MCAPPHQLCLRFVFLLGELICSDTPRRHGAAVKVLCVFFKFLCRAGKQHVETYLAATVCEQAEWEPRRKNTRGVSKVSPVPVLLLSADQCWRKKTQQLLLLLIIKPNNRAFIASAYLGSRAGVLKLQKHRLWKRSVDAVWTSRSLPWLLQTQKHKQHVNVHSQH